jgi:hypothetical protein
MFWVYFKMILWFLWQLPQNIVALVMMPFMGKMQLIRFENYCWILACKKMSGGISLGNFIFLDEYYSTKEAVIRHELGHVIQSHILGPIYLFSVGICSLANAMFNFAECYHSWWPEAWANKLAGLEVKTNKYGRCDIFIPDEE